MCVREREKLKKKLEINITDFKEGYNKKKEYKPTGTMTDQEDRKKERLK
jgi:hypothetical protein